MTDPLTQRALDHWDAAYRRDEPPDRREVIAEVVDLVRRHAAADALMDAAEATYGAFLPRLREEDGRDYVATWPLADTLRAMSAQRRDGSHG